MIWRLAVLAVLMPGLWIIETVLAGLDWLRHRVYGGAQ